MQPAILVTRYFDMETPYSLLLGKLGVGVSLNESWFPEFLEDVLINVCPVDQPI